MQSIFDTAKKKINTIENVASLQLRVLFDVVPQGYDNIYILYIHKTILPLGR
jgi:hypothetical protein